MQTLTVALKERSYPIHVGQNLLAHIDLILPHLIEKSVAIVTNETIAPLYLEKLRASLKQNNIPSIFVLLPDGETHKNWTILNGIFDTLLQNHCGRKTTLIALGGGVVGDIAGFAAATYMRGIPFIQIPTTLLAQVDSSVGGKTGINHPLGKNMIGAFYQPRLVLADTTTLNTLSDRELRAGIAEVIKYGLLGDALFFEWLEKNIEKLLARTPEALEFIIYRCCSMKAEIVEQDEQESGIRALLNLGHTFGHAIENGMGYGAWLHGEAVAAGMVMAADLSRRLNFIDDTSFNRVQKLISYAGLPLLAPNLGANRYLELMSLDKKAQAGKMRFILLKKIGQAFISEVPESALRATLETCVSHD